MDCSEENKMKAIVYTKYGSPDVLHLEEVPKPTPNDDEVLVKVRATAVNAADWRLMRADPFFVRFSVGLLTPKNQILGADVAGVVEAVGQNVARFQPSDAVYGDLSGNGWGGLAEYVCAPELLWARKPANLTFEEAAAVPLAAVTALQGLRDFGRIQPGQRVLIQGASGGVGTFAVQIAKAFGAEVTAVCSTTKMEIARAHGADHVIDYTREDFADNGRKYDLILAANGSRQLSDYERALTHTGIYVVAGGSMSQLFQAMLLGPIKSRPGGKTIRTFTANPDQKDLDILTELIEAGKVIPEIDRRYPLREAPEAVRYLEAGHARGKVIISLEESNAGN
jgi:NADPH:quinone reductase-like Zn-dependent oxidoreductase